jgi:hypothetical protein
MPRGIHRGDEMAHTLGNGLDFAIAKTPRGSSSTPQDQDIEAGELCEERGELPRALFSKQTTSACLRDKLAVRGGALEPEAHGQLLLQCVFQLEQCHDA